MGLDLAHVLSPERHYCEFECSACKRLTSLDSYVTLKCFHPICKSCCQRHKDNMPEHCPSCREPMGKLVELCTSQPLAFRVLQRIKVACPLRKRHNCSWAGDYKNVQMHIESHRRGHRPQESSGNDKAAPDDTRRSQWKTNGAANNSPTRITRRKSLEHRYLKDLPKGALKGTEDGKLDSHPSGQPDRNPPTGDTQIHIPKSRRTRRRWSMEFVRLSSPEPSDAPKSTIKRRNSADMVSLSSGGMSKNSTDAENRELAPPPMETKSVQRRSSLGRVLSARFAPKSTMKRRNSTNSPTTTGETHIHPPDSNRSGRRWSMEFMRLSSPEPSDAPKSTMKRRNSADMVSLSSGSMSKNSKDAESGELAAPPMEAKSVQRRLSLGRALSARFGIGRSRSAASGSENDNNINPAEDRSRSPEERRGARLTRTYSERFGRRWKQQYVHKSQY